VPVMPRNSMYPTKATMKFHSNPDRPASFDGCLVEELPADAGGLEILSEISVDCAPRRFWFRTAPAGIDVTFDLDAGRGLSVQAQTKTWGTRNTRTTSLSRAPTQAQLAAWTAEEVGLRKAAKDDFDEVGLARPLVGDYFPARALRDGLRTCVVCEMTWKSTRGAIQDAIYEGTYPKNYKVRGGTVSEENLLGLTCTHCKRAFCKVHLKQSIPSRLPGGKCPACGELLHSA
jgi:hypothetical protein